MKTYEVSIAVTVDASTRAEAAMLGRQEIIDTNIEDFDVEEDDAAL